eukprot:GHVR01108272.1.p1 GENE.GHVR01108272.1~~GHVR01108272.1.p1  ORF type:complete len:112 (-),score=14.51 GHVR01108272.1:303-638(-)
MKTLTATELKLQELLKGTELEDLDFLGFDNASDLIDNMNTQIDENEVIYYSNAIEYLAENDASLKDSLSLADELGYEVKNINSELLATLLQQQNMRDKLSKLTSDIEACFE